VDNGGLFPQPTFCVGSGQWPGEVPDTEQVIGSTLQLRLVAGQPHSRAAGPRTVQRHPRQTLANPMHRADVGDPGHQARVARRGRQRKAQPEVVTQTGPHPLAVSTQAPSAPNTANSSRPPPVNSSDAPRKSARSTRPLATTTDGGESPGRPRTVDTTNANDVASLNRKVAATTLGTPGRDRECLRATERQAPARRVQAGVSPTIASLSGVPNACQTIWHRQSP
jgi:hypothetical protein